MRGLSQIVISAGTVCFLSGLVGAAWAAPKWENLGLWKQGAFYVDRQSLVREGDFRRVYTALDYREPQKHQDGRSFRSTRSLLHLDCKKQEVRTLHLTLFAGPMLTGQVLEAEGILAEWQPIPGDTPMHRILWMMC